MCGPPRGGRFAAPMTHIARFAPHSQSCGRSAFARIMSRKMAAFRADKWGWPDPSACQLATAGTVVQPRARYRAAGQALAGRAPTLSSRRAARPGPIVGHLHRLAQGESYRFWRLTGFRIKSNSHFFSNDNGQRRSSSTPSSRHIQLKSYGAIPYRLGRFLLEVKDRSGEIVATADAENSRGDSIPLRRALRAKLLVNLNRLATAHQVAQHQTAGLLDLDHFVQAHHRAAQCAQIVAGLDSMSSNRAGRGSRR